MARWMYCWRCGTEMPMLDEHEWEKVRPLLALPVEKTKRYRAEYGLSLLEARDRAFAEALAMYKAITGIEMTNPIALWHHQISLFGPPCTNCGKPLRTPLAKRCVECGTHPSPSATD